MHGGHIEIRVQITLKLFSEIEETGNSVIWLKSSHAQAQKLSNIYK